MSLKNRLVGLGLACLVTACGGGGVSTQAVTTNQYVGAGSVWDVSLTSGGSSTFTIKHQLTAADPVDITITGDYVTLPSGFLLLTFNTVTGSSSAITPTPVVGDTAYALDVPGYVFLLKPISTSGASSTQIVPMVASGSCPTATISLNWVSVKSALAPNIATNEFFGTAVIDPVASTVTGGDVYALTAGFPIAHAASASQSTTCSAGVMHFASVITGGSGSTATGNPDIYYYITPNGGGIVHTDFSQVPASSPGSDNIFFAAPVETGTTLSALSGTYSGLVFDDNSPTKVVPVKLTCDATGQCIGSEINADTDVTVAGSDVIINLNAANSPSAGFMTGTIDGYNIGTSTVAGTPGNLACAIDTNANASGSNVMNCVAQSPDGTGSNMFNVFFVQR